MQDMEKDASSFQGRRLFKGNDTLWGIFYPTDYLIAIFGSIEAAQRARDALRSAGYSEGEVDAVPSDYVIQTSSVVLPDGTTRPITYTTLRSGVDTRNGQWFYNRDLDDTVVPVHGHAKQGAGFLAVRCASDAEARRVLRLLKPEHPRKVRRYGKVGVEELVR